MLQMKMWSKAVGAPLSSKRRSVNRPWLAAQVNIKYHHLHPIQVLVLPLLCIVNSMPEKPPLSAQLLPEWNPLLPRIQSLLKILIMDQNCQRFLASLLSCPACSLSKCCPPPWSQLCRRFSPPCLATQSPPQPLSHCAKPLTCQSYLTAACSTVCMESR